MLRLRIMHNSHLVKQLHSFAICDYVSTILFKCLLYLQDTSQLINRESVIMAISTDIRVSIGPWQILSITQANKFVRLGFEPITCLINAWLAYYRYTIGTHHSHPGSHNIVPCNKRNWKTSYFCHLEIPGPQKRETTRKEQKENSRCQSVLT